MGNIRKVGIYLDTKRGNGGKRLTPAELKIEKNDRSISGRRGPRVVDTSAHPTVLVVRTYDGTWYTSFNVDGFLSAYHTGGVTSAANYIGGGWPFEDAIKRFSITPSFLRGYGQTNQRKVKWATKRKHVG